MSEIIEFYAGIGINVPVKFSEFNDLQKAYKLLLDVLNKTGYNSYRFNLAISKGVLNWSHLSKIFNIGTTFNVITAYNNERTEYKNTESMIENDEDYKKIKKN